MKQILKWQVRLGMLLFPLFFIPWALDSYSFGKNWFWITWVGLGLAVWLADLLISKREEMKINRSWLAVVGLALWAVASLVWSKAAPGVIARSIGYPLGVGTWVGLVGWLFLLIQTADTEERRKQFDFLTAGGIIVGLLSLVVFLIPETKMPLMWPSKTEPLISISQGWSLTGSMLGEVMLMVFLAVGWAKRLMAKYKEGNGSYIVSAILTAFLALGAMLDLYRLSRLGLGLMDLGSAWAIAVEGLKQSPLLGVGAGNFIQAFNLYRPASFNLTPFWSTSFAGSSVGILHIWTELGVVGLAIVAWLALGVWKHRVMNFDFGMVGLALAAVILLPLNLVSLFILAWALADGIMGSKTWKLKLAVGDNGFNAMPWLVGVLVAGGVVWGLYTNARYLLANVYMRNSLIAAGKNDGSGTYTWQIKAIGINPDIAEYRRMYSQTNMALVKSILAKGELTDDDKQKAPVLMQQAVREAKTAVNLEPLNSAFWVNLASIYRDVAGSLEGAADWSLQSYQQAVALDPVNALIKLDMGGLLYAANNFEAADRVFEQSVTNKQDFANAWYNWAYSAKKLNKLDVAVQRLTQAVALVPVTSGDYEKASGELATWNKELADALARIKAAQEAAQPKPAETLKTPQPLPTGQQKVELPKSGNEPPKDVVAPLPSPTVTPKTTGTP